MLTKKHTTQFLYFYLICFVVNFVWFYFNRLLFSDFNPIFFYNKLDFTTNFLLATNIQQVVISSHRFRILLDLVFFLLPFLLVIANYFSPKVRPVIAIINVLYNLFYCLLLSIFTFSTTGQFVPWVIVPILFCCISQEKYTAIFNALRLIFIGIFFSAGVWKFATGALFNVEEMSAVLLNQHAQILVEATKTFKIATILFLVEHKVLSYLFYLASFIAEISFIVGFFTKKFDKYLAILLGLFLIFDFALMFIYYFSWVVFIGFLYFTKFERENKTPLN